VAGKGLNDTFSTVKSSYNGTARDRIFSVAIRFRLIQVLEVCTSGN